MGTLAGMLGEHSAVQGVAGELHQGVGEAPFPAAVVALAGGTGERLQGDAQGGASLGVEEAPEEDGAALDGLELQETRLHLLDLLGEEAAGVGGVAEVGAVAAELGHRATPGLAEQGVLIEGRRGG